MRKAILPHFTPLIRLSFVLTASIVTTKYCYGYIHTLQWLTLALGCFFTCLLKTSNNKGWLQSFTIYTCVFFVGGLDTSHAIDQQELKAESAEIITQEDLSPLDHAFLAAKACQFQLKKDMQNLGIKDQNYAVITAMTLGDKTSLDQETKDIYSISGASHVLAISGLHIGIIFQLFVLAFGGRKRRSVGTVLLSLTAIWAYVFFIGFPASAVRSATMISICSFALLAHRDAISFNNLAFAYCAMLIIHPLYLFDISFQMSFLAIGFILLLMPIFTKALTIRSKWLRWTYNMLCLSIAAQIGTAPIIAYYFGRFSCYSLLTSFIAIPAATLILYLSASLLLLTVASSLFHTACLPWLEWVQQLFMALTEWTSSCLTTITQACNTALQLSTLLPGASIDGIKINIPQLCLIYFGIIAGYVLIKKIR